MRDFRNTLSVTNKCIYGTLVIGAEEYTGNEPNGVYLQAFCNGLKEVLTPYDKDIVDLEEKALKDPYFPLLAIVSKVEEYSKLFEVLNYIIKQISEQNIHGCQILDFLHREMVANVDVVKESLKCIIQCCHFVFFKQLSSWLLYGQLIDNYAEFFIQRVSENARDQAASTSASQASLSSQEISDSFSEMRRSISEGSHKYEIQYNMLPSYIIPSLAQKILFIGETILMFGCEPRDRSEAMFVTSKFVTSIWGDREVEFYRKLQNLQAMKNFSRTEFEKTVDEFRSCVTEHLWKFAVEEAELFQQLKLMKDFFLLGRGELFLEFIRKGSPVLQNSPVGTSTRDVNQAFHIAARKISINDDVIDKFSFTLPGKGHVETDDIKGSWHLLILNYKVSWPLHLLFDDAVLDSYNHLFCFLLRIKKTQLELHDVWRSHMQSKTRWHVFHTSRAALQGDERPVPTHTTISVGSLRKSDHAVWHLRNRLMFLVDNLQYYLQVDVLESQFALFQSAVQATKDFEEIQKAHALFQANILSQTFLLFDRGSSGSAAKSNPVQSILAKFLDLCEKFCSKISSWGSSLKETELCELEMMVKEHECLVECLLQLLTSLSLHPCGSHLSQLLLRLDFNRWFSSSAALEADAQGHVPTQ
ncbi:hypothetical protein ANN_25412 [Periplaneta americana]|uniref:Gamma-tubulin complex component n=1 Tax=Periplaneta americana TaxID=6978 RepID=A0ABQ8S1H3_PERAM|nr:hypothetical protein ANN_25412 [Periplaneta americana]